ncbi:Signal recognition particle SEC65 subunit-like protein [Emericellopsis cladophorae]|uniref:Signal recognition particle SEC65 subunit-like protein n=1 Tax=Emericellopsis cladophorae TaxID=2686198 RepID=A0A9P9XXS5_9HYPO|nr:Signal recognition particle SEC65 subunit-like protein [Emericellopsis cladophorae]KAI6779814.1 Signal recognition particle SEC65 subunit-like protein [Emericellopsis cladophorae]
MSHHPRVEEVSDSDEDSRSLSDPSEVDIDDFADSDIIRQRQPQAAPAPPRNAAVPAPANTQQPTSLPRSADRAQYASFQCLYPVYFDAARTRAEGRRVGKALAVKDPLAREIANACSKLRLPTLLEPDKTHPRDWANPGRVKVGLKKAGAGTDVTNKHHLYLLIAQHLRENPTDDDSIGLRVRMGGQLQPEQGKPYPRPAVPRGWKMGELLPYTSAAMTGGGVSENLFKDMMSEMQGGGNPMAALMGGAAGGGGGSGNASGADEGGGKKKDKKKKKGKA